MEAARKVKRPSIFERFNKEEPKPVAPPKPGHTGSRLHEGWLDREVTLPGAKAPSLQRRYCVLYDDPPYLGVYVGEDGFGDKGSKPLTGATTKVTGEWLEVSIADAKFSNVTVKLKTAGPREARDWSRRIDCAVAGEEQPPPFDPTAEPPPEPAEEPNAPLNDRDMTSPPNSPSAATANDEPVTEATRAASMPGGSGKKRPSFLQSSSSWLKSQGSKDWGRISFSSQVVSTGMTELGGTTTTTTTPIMARGFSLFRKRSTSESAQQQVADIESVSDDELEEEGKEGTVEPDMTVAPTAPVVEAPPKRAVNLEFDCQDVPGGGVVLDIMLGFGDGNTITLHRTVPVTPPVVLTDVSLAPVAEAEAEAEVDADVRTIQDAAQAFLAGGSRLRSHSSFAMSLHSDDMAVRVIQDAAQAFLAGGSRLRSHSSFALSLHSNDMAVRVIQDAAQAYLAGGARPRSHSSFVQSLAPGRTLMGSTVAETFDALSSATKATPSVDAALTLPAEAAPTPRVDDPSPEAQEPALAGGTDGAASSSVGRQLGRWAAMRERHSDLVQEVLRCREGQEAALSGASKDRPQRTGRRGSALRPKPPSRAERMWATALRKESLAKLEQVRREGQEAQLSYPTKEKAGRRGSLASKAKKKSSVRFDVRPEGRADGKRVVNFEFDCHDLPDGGVVLDAMFCFGNGNTITLHRTVSATPQTELTDVSVSPVAQPSPGDYVPSASPSMCQ